MSRIEPLPLDAMEPDVRELLASAEGSMGFLPNDGRLMARVPGLVPALSQLVEAVYGPGQVDSQTKRLVAAMTSAAAGCRYCSAHTLHGAERAGIDGSLLRHLWDHESSPEFSEGQRAALHLARLSAVDAQAVDADDVERLREHFNDDQVVELVSVMALFAFLTRFNDLLRTDIEDAPLATLESQHDP